MPLKITVFFFVPLVLCLRLFRYNCSHLRVDKKDTQKEKEEEIANHTETHTRTPMYKCGHLTVVADVCRSVHEAETFTSQCAAMRL